MRFLIAGPGAVGGFVAARPAEGGHDVTVLARGRRHRGSARRRAVRARRARRSGCGGEGRRSPGSRRPAAADSPDPHHRRVSGHRVDVAGPYGGPARRGGGARRSTPPATPASQQTARPAPSGIATAQSRGDGPNTTESDLRPVGGAGQGDSRSCARWQAPRSGTLASYHQAEALLTGRPLALCSPGADCVHPVRVMTGASPGGND